MIYTDQGGGSIDPEELREFCEGHGVAIQIEPREVERYRESFSQSEWNVALHEWDDYAGPSKTPLLEVTTCTPFKATEVLQGLVLMVNPSGGLLDEGQRVQIKMAEHALPQMVYEAANATE